MIGGGGAGLAAAWNLAVDNLGKASELIVIESGIVRYEQIIRITSGWETLNNVTVIHSTLDAYIPNLKSDSSIGLIINASGLGKDRPCPQFDLSGITSKHFGYWDFNYRGNLELLQSFRDVEKVNDIRIYDGRKYFYCGWSYVMSHVAGVPWNEDMVMTFTRIAEKNN